MVILHVVIDEQLIQLVYTLLFLAVISGFVSVTLTVEWFLYTCLPWRTKRQRLNRLRFDYIEADTMVDDPHYTSNRWMYFSDAEEEGQNDPDVSYLNFNRPQHLKKWRRLLRRLFLW